MTYWPDGYGWEPMAPQLREQVERLLEIAELSDWEVSFLHRLLQTQEISSRQRDLARKIVSKAIGVSV